MSVNSQVHGFDILTPICIVNAYHFKLSLVSSLKPRTHVSAPPAKIAERAWMPVECTTAPVPPPTQALTVKLVSASLSTVKVDVVQTF